MAEAAIYLGREFEDMTADEKSKACRLLARNGFPGVYLTHADKTQDDIDFDRGAQDEVVSRKS